jgi:hypothetical protein
VFSGLDLFRENRGRDQVFGWLGFRLPPGASSCRHELTLLAHFAIHQLMAHAAWPRGLDPDRLSFTPAVRVIKRKMPQAAAVPP